MTDPRNIKTADYTYLLPEERIAKYPLEERDSSKLLLFRNGSVSDHIFRELTSFISSDSLLVFNNTKVIRARLFFEKETGAKIEVFCLEPLLPFDFAINLSSGPGVEWKCLVGNLKKWKKGEVKCTFRHNGKDKVLSAVQTGGSGETRNIRFSWEDKDISFSEVLQATGHIPIPPYLNREDEISDNSRYQTIYSKTEGSVAAPTAGLHFTDSLISDLERKGIEKAEVTLHVSAGTFKPVKAERIADHEMHTEHFIISRDTLLKLAGKNIIAVGTTSVRTLESLYWLGSLILSGKKNDPGNLEVTQWQPYETDNDFPVIQSLAAIADLMDKNGLSSLSVNTGIIIVPGYRFRLVKGLITNFHQPGSTLLLLVAAFTGNAWKDIYSHALESDYRFLSYGDSMLLLP